MIRPHRGKWVLYSQDGSEILGKHPTKAAAEAQEAAINISKARASGHHIPKPKDQK